MGLGTSCGLTMIVVMMVAVGSSNDSAGKNRSRNGEEPIAMRLTFTPDSLRLPKDDRLNLTCDLLDNMAALGMTVCRLSLFQLKRQPHQTQAEPVPLVELFAGHSPFVFDGVQCQMVVGDTRKQTLTLTIGELTCNNGGTYGCDVMYIQNVSGPAEEVDRVCARALESGQGVMYSSTLSRVPVKEASLQEVTLTSSVLMMSSTQRRLTLKCAAQTTDQIEGWEWSSEDADGNWTSVDNTTHDISSYVIHDNASSCTVWYSTLSHLLYKTDEGKRYRCRVVSDTPGPQNLSAIYVIRRAGASRNYTDIYSMQAAISTGDSSLNQQKHILNALVAVLGVLVLVMGIVAVSAAVYYKRHRTKPTKQIPELMITEPFSLQTLHPPTSYPRLRRFPATSSLPIYPLDDDISDHETLTSSVLGMVGGDSEAPSPEINGMPSLLAAVPGHSRVPVKACESTSKVTLLEYLKPEKCRSLKISEVTGSSLASYHSSFDSLDSTVYSGNM